MQMLGSSMGIGMAPGHHPDGPRAPPRCPRGPKKSNDKFHYSWQYFFRKYALKSVPDLADVGVPQGDGDGPRTAPRCLMGSEIFFQMTNLTMPNNMSFMKYALE